MKKTLAILLALAVFLFACTLFGREPTAITAAPTSIPTVTVTAATTVVHVPGSTHKICQLTGDLDRQTSQPTVNMTKSRYGVFGTDLGFSFVHEGSTYFLFGDTVGLHGGDSIAYTNDTNPDDCLELTFVTGADGRYLPPSVPGITLGAFEVPSGGFSANGAIYIFFTTDHSEAQVMGRSVLARSDDGAHTFTKLYDVSTKNFINIVPVIVEAATVPGLPDEGGQGLLAFGTGDYRRSNPYLAYVPLGSIEQRSAWLFYAGLDPVNNLPRWSENQDKAEALFNHRCLGELSVSWIEDLGKWVMLYNCVMPRGINMRSADFPWGPWSEGEVVFQPWDDGGYCSFMHVSYQDRNCDSVQDPGRDDEWAGEYGPYIIPSLARTQDDVTTVYFVLSTWNPYAVMLMKTDLKLEVVP